MKIILLALFLGVCFAAEDNRRAPSAGEAPSYPYPYATYNKYPYVAYTASPVAPAYYFASSPGVYYTAAPSPYIVPQSHAPSSGPPVGASVYYGNWQ